MKNYLDITDLPNLGEAAKNAIRLKTSPSCFKYLGENKTLIMLFFNSSLRTRISTEKAAKQLGMDVISLNVDNAWNIEFEDGAVMNLDKAEHIKEAAKVISQYGDIIAVRAFPSLKDKEKDKAETILNAFKRYANVPIVNMESATAHPLQAFTDVITILEQNIKRPKVVLSWAPHPRALPHAVANSFVKAMQDNDVDFVIANPEGYNLDSEITKETKIYNNQSEAFKNADIIYTKNWSSFNDYGKVLKTDNDWMITKEKIGKAKFMHCLPVRRNVVVEDAVLDGENSLVIEQANNRTYAAQYVLKLILKELNEQN